MNTTEISVKMVFDRWHSLIKQFETALDLLTDEQLQHEIAPNRNRGIYLLGHLIVVHDDMNRLLDFGDKLYPELINPFIESKDRAVLDIPTATTLRGYWKNLNGFMNQKFDGLTPEEWFERHTAVSAEDFANEPHRNKLNIIITRTSHLAWHLGQFILIK